MRSYPHILQISIRTHLYALQMFLKLLNTSWQFCSSGLVGRARNPYLFLHPEQLKPIINQKLLQPPTSIAQINSLIELGMASQNKNLKQEIQLLVNRCIYGLESIQKVVNQMDAHELAELDFGSLLNILVLHPDFLDKRKTDMLSQLYLNTYCHVFGFRKQLHMYESSRNAYSFDLVHEVSLSKINKFFQFRTLSFKEFVGYLRLFYRNMTADQVLTRMRQYEDEPPLRQAQEQDKLSFNYIAMRMNLDIKQVNNYQLLEPNLAIQQQQNPKSTCIKLEIMATRGMPYPNLDAIDLMHWDYDHLVWISEFSESYDLLKDRIHKKILQSSLPIDSQPASILNYMQYANISGQKHMDLCEWLCQNCQLRHEDSICSLLLTIYDKNWYPYYQKLFLKMLEMSLGNFKWENQTKIYYLGHLQNVNDENIEYLRRYILNTYASYGTSRYVIPTSSYFYKILEVVDVETFYKDLWQYC